MGLKATKVSEGLAFRKLGAKPGAAVLPLQTLRMV